MLTSGPRSQEIFRAGFLVLFISAAYFVGAELLWGEDPMPRPFLKYASTKPQLPIGRPFATVTVE
jgi:hypothetical protein